MTDECAHANLSQKVHTQVWINTYLNLWPVKCQSPILNLPPIKPTFLPEILVLFKFDFYECVNVFLHKEKIPLSIITVNDKPDRPQSNEMTFTVACEVLVLLHIRCKEK